VKAPTHDSFYGELERIFDQFPKFQMKILLGNFNAKLGREGISSQQARIIVHMKLAMIIELE
jgi:hypothetical protein